ncbi:hypothetical protein PV08_11840 [Exophiala spinifera]|uniref:Uncharacterized protein n=1 Tax=Exophiala spinifera TaxID=91928 RepID=A0A0D2BFF3_9EURO|nr:uncharacterized protein PV08_11840 [Exophiala spinifera]KIW10064.1 hypothetical protein PV08_11840 [Exophiala spinifera]
MLTIPTDREFRDVAARVTLPAEEFIPEPASEGIWRHLPSAQEPNEHAQRLVELYNKFYVG